MTRSWTDEKGLGFITPTEGGQDIFVHISECPRGQIPTLNEMLSFEVALNARRRNGNGLALKTIATTQQALRQIAEIERILNRLKTDDLPKAVADLKETTKDLRDASARVDMVSNIGLILLVVGLVLAAWCFVQSVATACRSALTRMSL